MTGAMSGAASCVAKGQCTNGAVAMCTSAASCSGGDVCCVSLGGGTGGAPTGAGGYSVTCKKTCGTGGLQLCAANAECGPGVTCQAIAIVAGAKICGGLGGGGAPGGFGGH
jgi:hypothetical protein